MGNAQGNQNDSRNPNEKQRKSSTVRGRVLARFRSRNNLPTNHNTAESAAVNCDNAFVDTRTETEYNGRETADIHLYEKVGEVDKRISQISQGADSAKDALDFGKF